MNFGDEALYDWAGYFGVAFYLISYTCLQLGLIRGSGYAYALMNMTAASLVLVSLTVKFNLASSIIQIMWIVISAFGIARIYWIRHRTRFNEEELAMVKEALPDMPRPLARRFLDSGVWVDAQPGTQLTREAEEVTHLHYLTSGEAKVVSGGRQIATLSRGFVGEMNVMEPGLASATVEIGSPSRIFSVPGTTLRRISASDSEFRAYLESHLSMATRHKLIEANKRLSQSKGD